jgi:thymidylate synthase
MTLTQRSNDYIMAGAINKIQYVALQMMVASHCGYKLGKFCHLVQNLHVYDRHMDAVKEILDRQELSIPSKNTQPTFIREYPSLELTTNSDFYNITVDDFKISGIDGIQKLSHKLEIAV